jgi:four helix bundle protein
MAGSAGFPAIMRASAGLRMYPYQRLIVWQRAHALAVALYRVDVLDESVRYRALVEQLRRCAGSISANIAEGAGSGSQPMFARYLAIALASAYELENHLLLAGAISCVSRGTGESLGLEIETIKKMLTVLIRKVRHRPKPA